MMVYSSTNGETNPHQTKGNKMTTNTITALVQIEVTNEKRNYAMGEAATMLNTLSSVKDISFPSINSAVTLDFNDAAFLGAILGTYIYQNKMENNKDPFNTR